MEAYNALSFRIGQQNPKFETDSKCDVHANRQIVESFNRNSNAIFGISVLLSTILMLVRYNSVGSAWKYVAHRKWMQHHIEC